MSTNAKDIAILYLLVSVLSACIGTSLSNLIRLELVTSGIGWLHGNHQLYNTLITLHALLMIFFFIMPILLGTFGNYMIPVLIGSPDMSLPRLNNLSFTLIVPSLALMLLSAIVNIGPGIGWTMIKIRKSFG